MNVTEIGKLSSQLIDCTLFMLSAPRRMRLLVDGPRYVGQITVHIISDGGHRIGLQILVSNSALIKLIV